MIYFCYRGLGGSYTNYLKDTVKTINRHRSACISSEMPQKKAFVVVVESGGESLRRGDLKRVLDREDVVFVIGDSKGMPAEIISSAQLRGSVSTLPIHHRLEAAIITEEVKHIISGED